MQIEPLQKNTLRQNIPWLMAAARAALGPFVILGQVNHWSGITLAGLIVAALLSDISDGILARRWHCDTPALRLSDSMADTVFFLGVAVALWLRNPQLWRTHWALLATLMALEASRFIFDIAKFGKPASYHSYLAKTWGLLLAIAVTAEFATPQASPLIVAALLLGIVCNLEGLAMSLILPDWANDVKTLRAAWNLRTILLTHLYPRTSSDAVVLPAARSKPRLVTLTLLIATIVFVIQALIVATGHAICVGVTLPHVSPRAIPLDDSTEQPGFLLPLLQARIPACGVDAMSARSQRNPESLTPHKQNERRDSLCARPIS
jgi:phosphatidylglycerophosphate synthase